MRCPTCGEQSDNSGQFCVKCGAALFPCASCGHANPRGAKFCGECGKALAHLQPLAERRQITVMFCDLVGSTALSERLDPEDLRDLIREYQTHCAEIVKRFDGSIVQYLGDGVLVYFGVPHAHEDDACRAGYAGLEIVQAMRAMSVSVAPKIGMDLAVRVGIHTGAVVVGEVGSGGRVETLAIGETPNIAARLQSVAAANSVAVSKTTHRLLSRVFRSRDLGPMTLPGVAKPMRAYELLAEHDARAVSQPVSDTGLSNLVGRRHEMATLLDGWRKARGGTRQIVVLRGEAGIGKSALVGALKEHVARDDGVTLEGDCSPYYENSAFYAITRALARWSGLTSTDEPADRQHKFESALSALSLADPAAIPLMANLMSIPVDAEHAVFKLSAGLQRARTLNLLLDIPPALAQKRPVLLLVEDLHWSDPSTLEFLSGCATRTEWSNVLVVVTARPEFNAPWLAHPDVTLQELGGLDVQGAEALVRQALAGKTLPPAVLQQIVQRADGVPLFIEETTRAIIESNVLHDAGDRYELAGPAPPSLVPVTLQDALMARVDRLESAKRVVQLGATIGREFDYELLCAVSGEDEPGLHEQLNRAVSSGLLQQHGTVPKATFVFKHALVQDTAYLSLLRKTREQYHHRIADVLEHRFRDTLEQRPELLAHHHAEAGNAAAAIPYWRKAGNRAIERAAFPEAIAHLLRGIHLLDTLPDGSARDLQELALQSALGMALQAHRGYAAPDVDRAYRRARELCQRAGTPDDLLSVSRGQNLFYIARGEYRQASAFGTELLKVGRDTASLEHLVEGHMTLGVNFIYLGRFVESRIHFEQSLAIHTRDHGPLRAFQYVGHSEAWCRSYLGRTLSFLGYYDKAIKASEAGLAVARTFAIPLSIAQAMAMHTNLYHILGDVDAADDWASKTIAYATEHGFPYWSSLSSMVRGWTLAHQGDVEQGIAQLRQGIDRNLATGAKVGRSWFLVMLAELYAMNRQWDLGLDAVARALAHVEETEERYYEAEAYRLKGELLSAQSSFAATDAAEACFRRAIEVAASQHAKAWELRASTSLARLWHRTGRSADARDLLGGVYGWFADASDVPDLRDARKVLADLNLGL